MNDILLDKKKKKPLKKQISQTQFIAYGFFAIIMMGSLFLMLPIASRDGAERALPQLPVYSYQRKLCDRPGGGGYLDSVELVWTDRDPDPDPVRRAGIYQRWNMPVHYSEKKDRSEGKRAYAGECEHPSDRRRGEAGKEDHGGNRCF